MFRNLNFKILLISLTTWAAADEHVDSVYAQHDASSTWRVDNRQEPRTSSINDDDAAPTVSSNYKCKHFRKLY